MPINVQSRANRRSKMELIEGWNAWLNKQPGPGATPTIHVTGKLRFPTGGYSADLERSYRQSDEEDTLVLELVVDAPGPDVAVTQALDDKDVHYEAETSTDYERVIVIRRDTVSVEIVQ